MAVSADQQKEHREAFIKECRQKAWNAACHADWISKELDILLAEFTKLQEEDATLEGEITTPPSIRTPETTATSVRP
jgi:hypothetical protein